MRFVTLLSASLLLAMPHGAFSQSVTGQISGTVTDPSGAAIAGATVRLTHDLTRQVRSFATESSGAFIFADLIPGAYSVRVEAAGFNAYEKRAIDVSAQEKVALHEIRLRVGDVTTGITVEADVAHVATDSSDRSVSVGGAQIENTPLRGRDWLSLVQMLPGVVDLNAHDVPGFNSGNPTINGGQTGQLVITLDGIVSQDSGAPQNNGYLGPSVDAIAEVKMMSSNYAAQYGSRGGGQLNVTIKSGTNHFHGSAYYFHRHEFLNANEYFNNQAGLAKPLYRFSNAGGTFGGPLLVPGTRFNKSRTKLFFFFSEDYLKFLKPGTLTKFTMPTERERLGDYSQTTTTTGRLISIKDPTTAKTFPGNLIPASRISTQGWALLNLFPLPFTTDPTGQRQYNAIYQFNRRNPREDRILRLDFNVAPRTQTFVRLINDYQADRGIGSTFNNTGGWGQLATDYSLQSAGVVATVIHTFRSNLVNELTVGINRVFQIVEPESESEFASNQRSSLRGQNGQIVALPKFYASNPSNLLPNVRFTTLNPQSAGQSITNAPAYTFDSRYPFTGTDQVENITNNLSWIKQRHNFKFGFYFERMARNVSVYTVYNSMGSFYFGSDTANPQDSGYGFSNLLIGTVQAYGEDNARFFNHARYNQFEWYAQDSWRVGRRFNLDLGVRFQLPGALSSLRNVLGVFDRAAYDSAKSGTLLYPAMVNGAGVALNRTTGATYQLARAGFFDPVSYPANGSPYSGMVQYNDRVFNNPGLAVGPRVGFAWDVLGRGKLALRGGFGVFYDRAFGVDTTGATTAGVGPITSPPTFQAPVYYNTTISQLLSAQGFLGPQTVFAGRDYRNPSTYNWSLGIQRGLPWGMILDAAYVGNVVHNKFVQVDNNGVAPFTTWSPATGTNKAYLDPTSGGVAFYNANLMRPIAGYGAINTSCSCGSANYNSLQLQLNKRAGKRLQFGANWTWSKTLTYTRGPWTPDYLSYAEVSTSRPHSVNLSYAYRLPNGSKLWSTRASRFVLDGWRVNGLSKFLTGNPLTVACTAQSAPIGYWTGTPTGGIPFRCQMAGGEIFLPAGSALPATAPQGRYYPLNAKNFSLPGATSLGVGNTPPTMFYGPGFQNFDISLLKDVRLRKEGRVVEFRAEAYNVFNHFNPGNPNTSLSLNYSSGANTNANFGTITAAVGQSRRLAIAVKYRF